MAEKSERSPQDGENAHMTLLKVRNVVVKFGKATILTNINLDIREGEIFGVVGLSGSGKTTLLNTIMGVLEPVSGDVYYKPQHIIRAREDTAQFRSVRSDPDDIKHTFGFSAQSASFYPKLTVHENLVYFGTMYGLSREVQETNSEILLDLVGLTKSAHQIAERLSGGMQKRLDIACALIHNPHVLIFDEPTADLDPVLRSQMWDLVRRINRRGTTVILASHFLEELESLCDRIAIIYDRQIVAVGTSYELQSRYHLGQTVVVETARKDYSGLVSGLKKAFRFADSHFTERNGRLIVHVPDAGSFIQEISSELGIESRTPERRAVPGLTANDVLRKVMQLLDKGKEPALHLVASRSDLNSIFEGIVLEGKEEIGKKVGEE